MTGASANLWNEVNVDDPPKGGGERKEKFQDIPDGRDRVGVVKETGVHEGNFGESLYIGVYDAASNTKQRFFYGINLSRETSVAAIKRLLKSLELPIPTDPGTLDKVLARAEGYEIRFDKWTKKADNGKSYQNIAITSVTKKGEPTSAPKIDIDDEEIPF